MLDQPQISIEARTRILHVFPCFSAFSEDQLIELAGLTQQITLRAHAHIVKENEIVDSVYFIVEGEAEVSREVPYKKHYRQVPVAILHTGEGIGLNDTGFYSSTGKRTATVTSMTPITLLKLDLKDLYAYLKKNNLESSMVAASERMLRMRFIKQSLPFSRLSPEQLKILAEKVKEVLIPEGHIIFKQGDQGDSCYLIQSGKVEILKQDNDAQEKSLAELKAPALFGEATLITHTPRNASAKAIAQTALLQLNYEDLSDVLKSESNIANTFMTLMVDRSYPDKDPATILHHRTTDDGQEITILKNPANNAYFKLSPEGEFIWRKLDGKHSLQEITLSLANEFNVFAPDVVVALISRLSTLGFITNLSFYQEQERKQNKLQKFMYKVLKLADFRYAFGDADAWLTKIYQRYLYYLFTKHAQIILMLLVIAGVSVFIASTQDMLQFFSTHHASLLLILTLIPLSMFEVGLHELGHAFSVKAFGREVHYMGIGWYYFAPVAFTDTSDMWLAPRNQRMIVNMAGVYIDMIVAGFASLLMLFIPNLYIQSILWLFALYTYINAFRMLSPMQELDGYYFLSDWVERPHLRKSAVLWLSKLFSKTSKISISKHKPELYYWIASVVYLILVTIITLLLQTFVLAVVGIKVSNPYLALLLPFIVLIISSLSIIAEIRQQK